MPGYRKYHSPEEKEEFADQLAADAEQRVIDLAENWEADARDVAEFLIFPVGSRDTVFAIKC